ncbi:MAG: hypothetical protein D6702_08290 [Planctomycetota bacterium]|nr:MAG: hypothetical protein D6702_08290 [Planctomycetota bacterium]
MPRLISLFLAWLIWLGIEASPGWVPERPEPAGLVGVLGVAWLIALRWGLPRPRRPWEAGPILFVAGPLLLHAAFLGAFGGIRLWQDLELPAAISSCIGVLPYLVIQHGFRYGEAGLLGLDGPAAAAFAQRHSLGLLLGVLPVAVVAQVWAWGAAGLPEDPALWTTADAIRARLVELGGAALALPLTLLLLPRLLGAGEEDRALGRLVAADWRGRGPAPRVLRWDTQGVTANALAAGFGPFRRILISDGLRALLTDQELRAVLGHELAHLERRHAPALVAGAAGGVLLAGAAVLRWAPAGPEGPHPAWALLVLAAAAPPLLVAGRAFETQADLDAAARGELQAAGLATALSRLGSLRRRRSWRHPTPAARVARIRACRLDPERAERFHRRAEWIRKGLWALFLTGLAGVLVGT